MKYALFTIVLFFALADTLQAQRYNYKKFRVGVGMGFANALGERADDGILGYLEPAYRLTPEILVGARLENAAIVRGLSEDQGINFKRTNVFSFSFFGHYYYGHEDLKPFGGLGIGVFRLPAMEINEAGINFPPEVDPATKIGFFPRIGFELGRFGMSVDYNFLAGDDLKNFSAQVKNSYMSFRVGFFIGGGKAGKASLYRHK